MSTPFPGFSPKLLTFFRQLEKNNDRAWFATHKEFFDEEIRRPMIDLVTILSDAFRKLSADYVPDKPEKAIYRIYRDTRFSKDKTPYKTHIGANFQHRRIEKNRGAGFYFQLSHEGLGIAGGLYMPGPDELLAVRRSLAQDPRPFELACKPLQKRFGALQGESAARVPKGFDSESPAADLLKRKQFYLYTELDAKLALSPKLPNEIMAHFKPLLPMVQFINDAIIESLGDEETHLPQRPAPMF